MTQYQDYIGREVAAVETAAREPFARLDALLDRPHDPAAPHLPPLGHWLMFLPDAPQADLGPDGHPKRGGFLPPIPLPMRMFAGSRMTFHAPLPFGAPIEKRSTIVSIADKAGKTGPLCFVTVRHDYLSGGALCLSESLDAVYRDRSGPSGPPPAGERRASETSRTIEPASSLLFRYSALTFNAHRIHYDRDYATKVEGYPGLLVHGPLLATLLMDHFQRQRPRAAIRSFAFRAQRPVYDLAPFTVNFQGDAAGGSLWAADGDGYVAMDARIEAEET